MWSEGAVTLSRGRAGAAGWPAPGFWAVQGLGDLRPLWALQDCILTQENRYLRPGCERGRGGKRRFLRKDEMRRGINEVGTQKGGSRWREASVPRRRDAVGLGSGGHRGLAGLLWPEQRPPSPRGEVAGAQEARASGWVAAGGRVDCVSARRRRCSRAHARQTRARRGARWQLCPGSSGTAREPDENLPRTRALQHHRHSWA